MAKRGYRFAVKRFTDEPNASLEAFMNRLVYKSYKVLPTLIAQRKPLLLAFLLQRPSAFDA